MSMSNERVAGVWLIGALLTLAIVSGCNFGSGDPPPPGQCFTTPGPIGCCGPLAASAHELQGIATYGCSNARQQVYQAKFSCGDQNECKSGKHKATVAGQLLAPSSCSGGFALFAVDDNKCPATW